MSVYKQSRCINHFTPQRWRAIVSVKLQLRTKLIVLTAPYSAETLSPYTCVELRHDIFRIQQLSYCLGLFVWCWVGFPVPLKFPLSPHPHPCFGFLISSKLVIRCIAKTWSTLNSLCHFGGHVQYCPPHDSLSVAIRTAVCACVWRRHYLRNRTKAGRKIAGVEG